MACAIIARKSGWQVRPYSRLGNDFTRRFPLIADASPKWLSKKCRPLSKKMQVKPPFSFDQMGAWWWPSGASKREEGIYENLRPMNIWNGRWWAHVRLSGPTNPFDQDQCITGHNVLQEQTLVVAIVLSGARALRACSVKT